MRIKVLLLVVVMLALVGCQGEKATVTGEYGAAVVSGQVVMADGSSPAGVAVSLRGTGISTTLAADGRFAFAGAPEDGELAFERSADGVAALLRLERGSGPLVIELAQSSAAAKSSGKRRGVGRGGSGSSVTQFEGVIRSASATQIVVFTSKQVEQTIALDAATIISKGRTILTAADLTVDTRVHVKAKQVESGFVATLVAVQNGGAGEDDGDRPEGREYEGTVVSAAAAQLVLRDARGVETTFVLDAATDIRKGNTVITAAEIQAGWRVHVKATTSADGATKTATRVIVQNNNGGGDDDDTTKVKLSGSVVAVTGTAITVNTGRATVTVQTDAATKIEKRGSAVALTSLLAGDRLKVEGTRVDATTILAKKIDVK